MSDSATTNPITGTSSIGGFTFSYSINTETNEITVTTSFDTMNIGTSTLSESHTNGTIFKNLGIQVLEGSIMADFQNSQLTAEVEIKTYEKVVYQNRGTIARW